MEVDEPPAIIKIAPNKSEIEARKKCIVIGCKNGAGDSNSNVRYFQVPSVATSSVNEHASLHLTKQWYINTLREDLFDELVKNSPSAIASLSSLLHSQPHFVCIEHFDEDSFVDNNNSKDLKPDAVPSLFEIEVFQKMIIHQEKFAQQQQLLKQQQQQLKEQQEKQAKFSLLTSLLSASESTASNNNTNDQTLTNTPASALNTSKSNPNEKVAKAVKRTALISAQKQQQLQQQKQQVETGGTTGVRMGKALKHTQSINSIRFSSLSNVILNDQTNQVENKTQKASDFTNLKDLLPPPIVQSARARASTNAQATVPNLILPNGHKLSGVRQASLIASVQAPSANREHTMSQQVNGGSSSSNKVTITTTYVYKKVTHEPDIDLDMECEEEEIEYIKRPVRAVEPAAAQSAAITEVAQSSKQALLESAAERNRENAERKDRNHSKARRDSTTTKTSTTTNETKKRSYSHQSQSVKGSSTSGFRAIFEKHYGRREGALQTSTMNNQNKKSIPYDLKIGNYPPKCNVCNIVLENNIELTSHICSHLETTGDIEQSTYISPFDAVTTMCSICEVQFEHPFDLIKHLDLTHMKQLDEFKCRICEKQHVKLNELIQHLSKEHKVYEMPYRCDACGFRTSFYADAIFHIKKEHTNTLHHFCPYCLKSFILPYQKKLGHVECALFYSHLQTHFNKQENNTVKPSRCKHCSKCILHVRFMNEHLCYDHSSNLPPPQTSLAASEHSIKSSKLITEAKEGSGELDISKRKRSTDRANAHTDEYDFESQEKKNQDESIIETKEDKNNKRLRNLVKEESVTAVKKQKVQKAMKRPSHGAKKVQETASAVGRKPRQRYRSAATASNLADNSDLDEFDNYADPSLPIRIYLFGNNLRFACSKDEFKCVECGHKDIKAHYKREYICHQCYYNTSCSRSFEYHLHGHLNKKRSALWNKSVNVQYEEYSCPCGFLLSSIKTSIGNIIAEHLNNCEYKYCLYRTKRGTESKSSQEERIEKGKDEEKPKTLEHSAKSDLHISSEGIIINDSSDDV